MKLIIFSFSEIITYWDIIKEYINPLPILYWGIVGGIVGFVLLLVVELALRKKILIRRRHWSLKVLSYLYMGFFPIFSGFCFSQWAALRSCESQLVNNIPTYLGAGNTFFNEHLKDELVDILEERHMQLTGHEVIDKSVSYVSETFTSTAESAKENTDNVAVAYLLDKLSDTDFIKKEVVAKVEKSIGEKLLMDENLTKDVLDVKVENLLNDGVLNTIAEKHIRNIFGGFKWNVILIFFVGLLIPVIEIVVANYMEKKRLSGGKGNQSTPPPILSN